MRKLKLTLIGLASIISVNANAVDTRAEAQLGITKGDPEISFAGASDDLDTGTGLSIGAGVWFDGVVAPNISLGLQYNRLTNADYSDAIGATLLGNVLAVNVNIDHDVDLFMLNAVFRDNSSSGLGGGKFHPYIGGGIGLAKVDADINVALTINGVALATAAASDDDTSLAGQIMAGFDYDVSDSVYVGANASYMISDTKLFGADVDIGMFRAMGVLGFRF